MYPAHSWLRCIIIGISMLAEPVFAARRLQSSSRRQQIYENRTLATTCCKVTSRIESAPAFHGLQKHPVHLDLSSTGFLCQRSGTCERSKSIPVYERDVHIATVVIGDGEPVGSPCGYPPSHGTLLGLPAHADKCSSPSLWLIYARWMLGSRRADLAAVARANLVRLPAAESGPLPQKEPWSQLFRDWKRLDDLEKFLSIETKPTLEAETEARRQVIQKQVPHQPPEEGTDSAHHQRPAQPPHNIRRPQQITKPKNNDRPQPIAKPQKINPAQPIAKPQKITRWQQITKPEKNSKHQSPWLIPGCVLLGLLYLAGCGWLLYLRRTRFARSRV